MERERHEEPTDDLLREELAPEGFFDDPEIRAQVFANIERIKKAKTGRGKTGPELRQLASLWRDLDAEPGGRSRDPGAVAPDGT